MWVQMVSGVMKNKVWGAKDFRFYAFGKVGG